MATRKLMPAYPLMWAGIVALLVLPLLAMRFTVEVNWTAFDFVVAGCLLGGAGLAFELLSRRVRTVQQRLIVGAALLALVGTLWVNGAVGIF